MLKWWKRREFHKKNAQMVENEGISQKNAQMVEKEGISQKMTKMT